MTYRQKGQNSDFPNEIETWCWGETVPEWLSDIAKVAAIDSNTSKVQLEVIETNTGGFSLKDSSGQGTLITLLDKRDILCREAGKKGSRLFTLTALQLKLLYYGNNE